MDRAFALFGKLSLGILIAAILVGGGVFLGLKGNKNSASYPTPANRVMPTPTAVKESAKSQSSSPSANTNQTVVVNGTSPFVSFSASIPYGWQTKKETIADRVKVTFSDGTNKVIISQAAGGGGQCVYPGEKPANFSTEFQSPTLIKGSGGNFKRAAPSIGSQSNGIQNFTVCELRIGNYQFPTEFGYISYKTDLNPSESTLSQLDQIVASLKKQ